MLWHDCEIDKFENRGRRANQAFAAVVPVFSLDDHIQEPDRPAVRAGQNKALFPLPGFEFNDEVIEESYVDLRRIWNIRQAALQGNRIATLGLPWCTTRDLGQ